MVGDSFQIGGESGDSLEKVMLILKAEWGGLHLCVNVFASAYAHTNACACTHTQMH